MNVSESKLQEINMLAKQLAAITERTSVDLANVKSSLLMKNGLSFQERVRSFEINLIINALIKTGGNQTKAAQILGIRITTLNNKIKHYSIPVGKVAKSHLQSYLSNMET